MANIDVSKNNGIEKPFGSIEKNLAFVPAFEMKETNDGYLFKADVPGVKREDIEVKCTPERLTISGKREAEKEEKTDTFYAYERSFGSFSRSFAMPEGIEPKNVHVNLKDGVLTVDVPKVAAKPKKG